MKMKKMIALACLMALATAGTASAASSDIGREQSEVSKMLHKLGRGIVNIFTCWVEVPRQVAKEWERTDPATGVVLGTVKGVGWGFTRLATGVYETFTFPFPVPSDYAPMLEPEFVVTDVWGDPIPDLTEFDSNDPSSLGSSSNHPSRFRF